MSVVPHMTETTKDRKTSKPAFPVLLFIMLFLAAPLAYSRQTGRMSWLRLLIVRSASMEPSITVGSVVTITYVKPHQVSVGDVITFKAPTAARSTGREYETLTTHRVVAIHGQGDKTVFVTKGDANEDPDPWSISGTEVVGRVAFSIPCLGYAVNLFRTPAGFIVLVLVPSILLIAAESKDLASMLRIAGGARGKRPSRK